MPALRTIGTIARITARIVHTTAIGVAKLVRLFGRGVVVARAKGAGGEPGMARLLDLHAASCAGDTLITIGLAGTIFFTVPAGEARGRVAMYLLVTMLPFALLAPIVGPVLDRFRHGRRYALAATMLGRAFLALLISEHLGGVALYPAAFGVLVLSRAYGVARSAAVPRVIPSGLGLSEAGARASVFGTAAGAIVAPIGVAAAAMGSAWPLRLSTIVFFYGMITALRLPPRADSDPPESVPRLLQRGGKGSKILTGRVVVASLVGSASLRVLYGYLTLALAFAIRSDALDPEVLGRRLPQGTALAIVAGALGLGSLIATAIGTRLRIRRPAALQAAWLILVAVAAIFAVIQPTLMAVTALCLLTAVASGLAKLTVDAAIQERIDERVRASAFAHSETLLMTAWVAGGALGLVPLTGRWTMAVAAGLALAAAARAVAAAVLLRRERLRGSPAQAGTPATAAEGDADRQPAARRPAASPSSDEPRRSAPRRRDEPRRPDRPRLAEGADRPAPSPPRRWFRRAKRAEEPAPSLPRPSPAATRPARAGQTSPPAPAGEPNSAAPRDGDDSHINPPRFHLYRPSALDDDGPAGGAAQGPRKS